MTVVAPGLPATTTEMRPAFRRTIEKSQPGGPMRFTTRGALILLSCMIGFSQQRGVLLEDLTWLQAEKVLKPDTIVVIPIGAASKEHGPHLKLKNDWLMAEY